MTAEQLDLVELIREGESRKRQGVRAAAAATDDWWASCCDRAIEAMARTGKVFQAFDLVQTLGLAEPAHPNSWGPRFSAAAKRGLIEPAGYGPSLRPSTARSAVRVWRGTKSAVEGTA